MPGYSNASHRYLFSTTDLRELLERQLVGMRTEVENLPPDRFLNTAPSDLARYLTERYTVDAIRLNRQDWHMTEEEIQVDVRYDRRRAIFDDSRPIYVPGQRIQVFVPFSGEAPLFHARPPQFTMSPPAGEVKGNELVLTFEFPHDSAPELRPMIDQALQEIESYLAWSKTPIDSANQRLPEEARQVIEARRNRVLANQGRASSLGIPVRPRTGAPTTYAVPTARRKAPPSLPPASSAAFEPEPIWAMEHYEHALGVIQSMAQLLERSPAAFAKQNEEHLRDQFLFQLNGHFEGRATGETFNVGGKTDILLRENNRNVFIAECKFWKGSKAFHQAIDQLLGYQSWRDTKMALLVFNRETNMTTVLNGISETATAHPNYKQTLPWNEETGFRYVFHHNSDANREFILSVLAFDVPN